MLIFNRLIIKKILFIFKAFEPFFGAKFLNKFKIYGSLINHKLNNTLYEILSAHTVAFMRLNGNF